MQLSSGYCTLQYENTIAHAQAVTGLAHKYQVLPEQKYEENRPFLPLQKVYVGL